MPEVDAFAAPTGAVCARHPEVAGILSCSRCGDYCGACCARPVDSQAYCPACAQAAPRPVGIPLRLLAAYIDYYIVFGVLTRAYDFRTQVTSTSVSERIAVIATLISVGAVLADAVLLTLRGQTIGAWLCGMRVVTEANRRPRPWTAIGGRLVVPLVAIVGALNVPYGMIALVALNFGPLLHPRRRSLLDLLTRTRVVQGPRLGHVPT